MSNGLFYFALVFYLTNLALGVYNSEDGAILGWTCSIVLLLAIRLDVYQRNKQ
jgi:hypothetical protein